MSNWQQIRYPAPLNPGDTIGITAPSSGVLPQLHARLNLCISHLKSLGFKVIEGDCLRQNAKHVSGSCEARVHDLFELWKSPDVKAIFPPWGGELLIHLLPRIDFAELAAMAPKWILGYSDTSTLLFALTTMTGIATAHGTTLMEMVPAQRDTLSCQWRDVLGLSEGGRLEQHSSIAFQINGPKWSTDPSATFNLTEKTNWRCMQGGKKVDSLKFSGRVIGGCLETLAGLVGTPYGDLAGYKSRFRRDGIILYLENAESAPATVCRMLWNMRLAGWFDDLAGIMLGRSAGPDSDSFSYEDALHDVFDSLPVPIIYDADIGHRQPQLTIINGAMALMEACDGRGSVSITLS